MTDTHNPYHPPLAEVAGQQPPRLSGRPKMVAVLVLLYLSLYPLFVWRVSLGGKLQIPALVIVFFVVGIYTACVAHALFMGRRWARAVVLVFALIWFCMLMLVLLGGPWEIRTQVFVVEALLKSAVAVMLLLPSSRGWFSPRSRARPA